MFIANVGNKYNALADGGLDALNGIMLRASAQVSSEVQRRQYKEFSIKLFDPQVYFFDFDLDLDRFKTIICKLATYPWFLMDCEEYDSDEGPQKEWKAKIKDGIEELWKERRDIRSHWEEVVTKAITFQLSLNVTQIILPATLISSENYSLSDEMQRLEAAVKIAKRLTDKPLYASLIFEDSIFRHEPFAESELIDSILDGFSSRNDKVDGYYLAFSMTSGSAIRFIHPDICGAFLRLASELAALKRKVIVNFSEGLGIFACALGAHAHCSNYDQKSRRLFFGDYQDAGGGFALPKFFSGHILTDLFPERDLEERISARNMLRKFSNDRTEAGEILYTALKSGISISSIPAWAETKNNTATAARHFLQNFIQWTLKLPSSNEAYDHLQDADELWVNLSEKFKQNPIECADGRHISVWMNVFEKFVQKE